MTGGEVVRWGSVQRRAGQGRRARRKSFGTPSAHGVPSAISESDFERVYRSHVRRVYGFLARRVGPSLAEDITAQTFLEVWSGWNRFDSDRGSETAWVFGIAANLLRRHRRRENAQLRAYARAGADPTTVDFDEAGVVDRVTVRAGWSQVATVLAALSDTDRNILTLTGWAGLSYEEVAFALQVPIGTVKSRLNRARAKLGQALVPAMGSVSNHRSVGVGVR